MTLEFILWLVAWVVISEVVFIIFLNIKSFEDNWIIKKVCAFLASGVFIIFQIFIVFATVTEENINIGTTPYYIRLVYESIFLGVVSVLFFCNWLISRKIDNRKLSTKEEEKKKDEEDEKERTKKTKQEVEDWSKKVDKKIAKSKGKK